MNSLRNRNACPRPLLAALLLVLFLVAGGSTKAWADTVIFTANTTIGVGDNTHDGKDVIVRGCTVTINGAHSYASLSLENSGVVTHTPALRQGMALSVAGDVNVPLGSAINVDACGFGRGEGPGRGQNNLDGGGSGASFGGEGTYGRFGSYPSAGPTYGNIKDPADLGAGENLGSGGGTGYNGTRPGGVGGGAIRLTVGGILRVDGVLDANGTSGDYHGGGGSGGSLYLQVGTLTGVGAITSNGGYGYSQGGAGGGGRIVLLYNTDVFSGLLLASGNNSDETGRAGAGTIFRKQTTQTQGDLWVNNNGARGGVTPLNGPHIFNNVRVFGQGTLGAPVLQPLSITTLGDFTIADGYVSAAGRGFGPRNGLGAGNDNAGDGGGAGGSYGGRGTSGRFGTTPVSGPVYGDAALPLPLDFGSGGGSGYNGQYGGGAGGGAIHLIVNGTLSVEGRLEVNGVGGNYHSGGGSGGSLLLRVGALAGKGLITAYGGYGYSRGGAGGGGRIALYFVQRDAFTGTLSAAGAGSDEMGTAEAGTVKTEAVSANISPSLTVTPGTLGSGQTAVGQVTLSGPAPAPGIDIALASSNPQAATVPPSVTIAEGETTATFTITAASVTQQQTAKITARLWDQISTQTLTVKPWLGTLKLNPSSVSGGTSLTGTLTLNLPAPAGAGLTVALSTSNPAVTVPATVNIPAGTTTRNFTISVGAVATAKTVTVRASYLDERKDAVLSINPAGVVIRAVAVSPGSVIGGNRAYGVASLNTKAPTGGVLVALGSSDAAAASVSAWVLVPAGRTSASFAVTTKPVAGTKTVLISATLGATKMTTLTVRLAGVSSLMLVPPTVTGGETSIGVVTLDASSPTPVTVTITSNKPEAIPESTIIIPAGQTTGTFVIDTTAVASNVVATITAKANGLAKSQMLTITP